MSMKSTSLFLLSTLAFLLSSCAGSSHPRLVTPSGGPISPRYLEIYSEPHAATLHFPAGVYTLNAVDKIGYYHRAPIEIFVSESHGAKRLWKLYDTCARSEERRVGKSEVPGDRWSNK